MKPSGKKCFLIFTFKPPLTITSNTFQNMRFEQWRNKNCWTKALLVLRKAAAWECVWVVWSVIYYFYYLFLLLDKSSCLFILREAAAWERVCVGCLISYLLFLLFIFIVCLFWEKPQHERVWVVWWNFKLNNNFIGTILLKPLFILRSRSIRECGLFDGLKL